MTINDRFYKSTEVADILGVSLRTLYRYMDSGKIESVQLPSGRHRFTKKQIEDFLYSNGSGLMQQPESQNSTNDSPNRISVNTKSISIEEPKREVQPDQKQEVTTPESVVNNSQHKQEQPEEKEDKLDAELEDELEELLKSLEEDDEEQEEEAEVDIPSRSESSILSDLGDDSDMSNEDSSNNSGVTQQLNENKVNYFYCPYNELRTIARKVKQTSEENDKEYGFTMNAGLSLYFPLDPFSIIHFYIKEEDLDFWKDKLQLRESTPSDANIGVLLTNGNAFKDVNEVSGLKVVRKDVLLENLRENNQPRLASEADNKL